MMHFPGGSNTRKNPLAYKYTGKKSTDFRLPRGLEDGSQRWNWRNVRLVTSTKFCSFVLQTLRCSVRWLNKNERLFCTFDLQLNVVVTSMIDISTIVLRTDGSSTRVTRTDLSYWKGTLLSQIISVLSTALILSYYCMWNA